VTERQIAPEIILTQEGWI